MRLLLLVCLIVAGCSHTRRDKENVTAETIGQRFYNLEANGVKSVTCRVSFPPMTYLAKLLEREGKISRDDSSQLRDQAHMVTAYTDGTPCYIQGRARPKFKDPEISKQVEHFADVASAAINGSCQMFALGYLRSPVEFQKAQGRWERDKEGNWLLDSSEGVGQKIMVSKTLKRVEIVQDKFRQPFVIEYEEFDRFLLPSIVRGHLEGQGAMTYSAKYTLSKNEKPVPLSTLLVIDKPGRDPIKMGVEFADCTVETVAEMKTGPTAQSNSKIAPE